MLPPLRRLCTFLGLNLTCVRWRLHAQCMAWHGIASQQQHATWNALRGHGQQQPLRAGLQGSVHARHGLMCSSLCPCMGGSGSPFITGSPTRGWGGSRSSRLQGMSVQARVAMSTHAPLQGSLPSRGSSRMTPRPSSTRSTRAASKICGRARKHVGAAVVPRQGPGNGRMHGTLPGAGQGARPRGNRQQAHAECPPGP